MSNHDFLLLSYNPFCTIYSSYISLFTLLYGYWSIHAQWWQVNSMKRVSVLNHLYFQVIVPRCLVFEQSHEWIDQPWDMSVWAVMVDALTVKCWWCTQVGLAGYASSGSCACCVFYVGGSGQTVLRAWRQHPVLCLDFWLLLLLTPEGSGICLPLSLPFKGCDHCKQALEKKIETVTFFCEHGDYGSQSCSIGISLFIPGGFVIRMWDQSTVNIF